MKWMWSSLETKDFDCFDDDLQIQMTAPEKLYELLLSMQSCISVIKALVIVSTPKVSDNRTDSCLMTQEELSISVN